MRFPTMSTDLLTAAIIRIRERYHLLTYLLTYLLSFEIKASGYEFYRLLAFLTI
jgi:hypothetical protein